MTRKAFFLFCFLLFPFMPVAAQEPATSAVTSSNDPIEITAGQTLEWHRKDLKYIARGDVVAKQGRTEIRSAVLTADYREGKGSATEIQKLTAEQNVTLTDQESTAYGDVAVYDVAQGYAVLTGQNLKLVSPEQTITARDKMEYWTARREASAVGNAKVTRPTDTITADTLKAFFVDDPATGKTKVSRMEAIGHVVIITKEEKLTGDKGIYKGEGNTAELIGHVRIERGPNVLEGERAEVNLTTNISKMFGGATSPTGDSRVRGVFYPGSEKKPETKKEPTP